MKWLDACITGERSRLDPYCDVPGSPPAGHMEAEQIAVGSVDLSAIEMTDDRAVATVKIAWNFKDSAVRVEQLQMARSLSASSAIGLTSVACPACGAPLADTDVVSCRYCKAPVTKNANEWNLVDVNRSWAIDSDQERGSATPHSLMGRAGAGLLGVIVGGIIEDILD